MLSLHDWPIAASLCDGRVFVGGKNDLGATEAEIYDPVADAWTPRRQDEARPHLRHGHAAPGLPFAAHRRLQRQHPGGDWNPENGTFKVVLSTMNNERFFHTTTLLADGRVLVAGGGVDILGKWSTFSSADIFDPATNLWTKAAKMFQARRAHTATLLPDGKVLVAGGNTGGKNDGTEAGKQLATAELYDPLTNKWQRVPSKLATARTWHTAALVPSGAVLLFGGLDGSGSTSRQVDAYFEGAWQALEPMQLDRYQHASALLDDGRVLLAGGVYQATAEVYSLAPKGQPCTSNLACDGGYCVDGVC